MSKVFIIFFLKEKTKADNCGLQRMYIDNRGFQQPSLSKRKLHSATSSHCGLNVYLLLGKVVTSA